MDEEWWTVFSCQSVCGFDIFIHVFKRLGYWFPVKDLYDHIAINCLNIGYLEAITGPLKLIEFPCCLKDTLKTPRIHSQ